MTKQSIQDQITNVAATLKLSQQGFDKIFRLVQIETICIITNIIEKGKNATNREVGSQLLFFYVLVSAYGKHE